MRHRCLSLFLLLAAIAGIQPARAQSQAEAVRQAADGSVSDDGVASPWDGSMTFGTQFSRGASNVNGVSVQGSATHNTPSRQIEISWTGQYADVRPVGSSERVVGQDREMLTLGYERRIAGPWEFISHAVGEHDRQRGLNYRATWMNGVEYSGKAGSKFLYEFTPGLGLTWQHKNYVPVNDRFLIRPGFFEATTYSINQVWSFHQHALYLVDRADIGNSSFDGVAQLAGMFSRRIGMQISYNFNYEGIVGPGFNRGLTQLTVGLKFQL